jgi:hypothetical protein
LRNGNRTLEWNYTSERDKVNENEIEMQVWSRRDEWGAIIVCCEKFDPTHTVTEMVFIPTMAPMVVHLTDPGAHGPRLCWLDY